MAEAEGSVARAHRFTYAARRSGGRQPSRRGSNGSTSRGVPHGSPGHRSIGSPDRHCDVTPMESRPAVIAVTTLMVGCRVRRRSGGTAAVTIPAVFHVVLASTQLATAGANFAAVRSKNEDPRELAHQFEVIQTTVSACRSNNARKSRNVRLDKQRVSAYSELAFSLNRRSQQRSRNIVENAKAAAQSPLGGNRVMPALSPSSVKHQRPHGEAVIAEASKPVGGWRIICRRRLSVPGPTADQPDVAPGSAEQFVRLNSQCMNHASIVERVTSIQRIKNRRCFNHRASTRHRGGSHRRLRMGRPPAPATTVRRSPARRPAYQRAPAAYP